MAAVDTLRSVRQWSAAVRRALARSWHLWSTALLAAMIRLPGVFHGLPYVRHPDEPVNYEVVHSMVVRRSPLPGFYDYPSLQYTVQAVVHAVYATFAQLFGQGSLSGLDMPPGGLGTNLANSPGAWIAARLVTLCTAALGVALVAHLATRLSGSPAWGVVAGVLAAVSRIGITTGAVMTPDALAGTTAIAVVVLLVHRFTATAEAPTRRWTVLTGTCLGLAVGAKYNNVLLLLLVAATVALLPAARRPTRAGIALLVGVSIGVGLLTTPGAILDASAFTADVRSVLDHYGTGHVGAEGNTLTTNLGFLGRSDPLAVVLATVGIIGAVVQRRRAIWLVAGWVVVYFLVISAATVRFDRNLTPVLGSLAVLAALGAQQLWRLLRASCDAGDHLSLRRMASGALVVALVVPAGVSQADLAARAVRRTGGARLATSAAWLADRIPVGATVLLDAYSPWVDTTTAEVSYSRGLAIPSVDELGQFDVVVVTRGGWGRFLGVADRYPAEAARVMRLRAAACRLDRYSEGTSYWMEVLRLDCST
jgi:hypothetical protein